VWNNRFSFFSYTEKSLGLHGIQAPGLSLEEYKRLLLHHIFAGACVEGPEVNGRTACHHFVRGFTSAKHMACSAFDLISSATSMQCSTENLLHTLHFLGLSTTF
jgi:hypothetical protein